jgi:hypothetical protein
MYFTIGKYDIELTTRARKPWSHYRKYLHENGTHWVWGRFSLMIEDWTIECHPLCADCDSPDIGTVHYEDEGWLICNDCRTVEGSVRYVNKRVMEQL